MEPTNQNPSKQDPTNPTAHAPAATHAVLGDQDDEHLDLETELAALKTMDPAESPGRAEAIADHLMRELNSNSATGGPAAS